MEICSQGLCRLLVQQNLLTEEQVNSYKIAAKNISQRFIDYLIKNSILSAKNIALSQAKYFNLSFVDLDEIDIDSTVESLIDDNLICKYNLLPLFCRSRQLFVAMDDLSQHAALQDVRFHTGLHVIPMIVESTKLAYRIKQYLYKKEHQGLEEFFISLPAIDLNENELNLEQEISDAPVIKLVSSILQQAIKKHVSDIHFEPYNDYYRIRFRQDGLLYEVLRPPQNYSSRISARLKIMANLDLSERKTSQDGRFNFKAISGQTVDCRLSTCPTISGEKIVVRILNPDLEMKPEIDFLALQPRDKLCLLQALASPQGLILVTGPTGSGKSVTLYAALNYLNTGKINISTVEDPVEIKLAGINQVQINSKIGLNFTNVLRSFLRQDPDVIMIGEIRDLETAEIAVNASQTGHLVLSTLHTNSAAETLVRLINIGIPTFHLINTIKLIIAQRLIRKLCEHCKSKCTNISQRELKELGFSKYIEGNMIFYKANGCGNCTLGYSGRMALFEVMPMSESINNIMLTSDNKLSNIVEQAELEGMHTIKKAGFMYVRAGITSFEELCRVT